jgi:hypothetical protein
MGAELGFTIAIILSCHNEVTKANVNKLTRPLHPFLLQIFVNFLIIVTKFTLFVKGYLFLILFYAYLKFLNLKSLTKRKGPRRM